jgi:hypothetical protein
MTPPRSPSTTRPRSTSASGAATYLSPEVRREDGGRLRGDVNLCGTVWVAFDADEFGVGMCSSGQPGQAHSVTRFRSCRLPPVPRRGPAVATAHPARAGRIGRTAPPWPARRRPGLAAVGRCLRRMRRYPKYPPDHCAGLDGAAMPSRFQRVVRPTAVHEHGAGADRSDGPIRQPSWSRPVSGGVTYPGAGRYGGQRRAGSIV